MLINHVLSSPAHSSIFDAIFDYFRSYAPSGARITVSLAPLPRADIVHYHRPQLERRLVAGSFTTVHHDLRDTAPTMRLDSFLPRYREAAHVICLNQGQAASLRAKGIDAVHVIPHGYNQHVLHRKQPAQAPTARVRLGFISKRYRGRFKGEAYLQELAKRLSPASFEFVLVGQGRTDTALFLQRLGFHVRSYEYLPYALFQDLYESIDYLLMCSAFEGGPANLPEAFATATPVLATPVGFAPDFIRDAVNGLLLSDDIEREAQRVSHLAHPEGALATTLRIGAGELASTVPTWQEIVTRHFALYERALQQTRHA